jgi:hypothetical protein
MTITVCAFSCKIPLISVRFPKNWNVWANSGENPQKKQFTKISQEGAGFYADFRTDGQLLSTTAYSMHTSGRTDVTYRRLPKMFLITITHIISRSATQTVTLIVCTERLFT